MEKKIKGPIYTLNIFHQYDNETKNTNTIFIIQTVRIFTGFKYEILLEDEFKDETIAIHIGGLHVPDVLIPEVGPAEGRREYSNLEGLYRIIITKQDKSINEFIIEINGSRITVKEKPKKPFILISTQTSNEP